MRADWAGCSPSTSRAPPGARLVLTGRSSETPEIRALIERIGALGGEAVFIRCDVTERRDTLMLADACRSRFGKVDGILHAAGLIRDALAFKKSLPDFRAVLAPKVDGTLNLDHAFAGSELDFFALFSSITGVMGNPGQSDYAFANGFMDAFAEYREGLRRQGARCGRTLSIGWPLWKEGGMHADPAVERMLSASTGLSPMPTSQGLAAFMTCLASPEVCITVAAGQVPKPKRSLGADWEPPAVQHPIGLITQEPSLPRAPLAGLDSLTFLSGPSSPRGR